MGDGSLVCGEGAFDVVVLSILRNGAPGIGRLTHRYWTSIG
jgi:hypothetical protein